MAQTASAALARRTGSLKLTIASVLAGALLVLGLAIYMLWPRQFAPVVAVDAPSLPITIGGIAFNVPAAAIRVPQQRQAGAHERIELAFLWPALTPPDPAIRPAPSDEPRLLDRLFLTLSVSDGTLPPIERARTIYLRFLDRTPVPAPDGLVALPFRAGSPYQGEDLVFDSASPPIFLARCSRGSTTPGICLIEQRIGAADIVVRAPREWLPQWQKLSRDIDRLIGSLRPPGTKN
jgi:hypothetical protein